MPVHDFRSQRLYINTPISKGGRYHSTREQHNYLCNVLRLKAGDQILVFNGRDGEWLAHLSQVSKHAIELTFQEQVREQHQGPGIDYLFAPLKRARLDYMVQKAVELGVARLAPVFTRHTIVKRVNLERMLANAIEAAEQCAILHLPVIDEPISLEKALADWPCERPLIFADEEAEIASPIKALKALKPGPIGVLIGPEGGFSQDEREKLMSMPHVTRISLGPRIMRADTAAVAVLTLVNACLGGWRVPEKVPEYKK